MLTKNPKNKEVTQTLNPMNRIFNIRQFIVPYPSQGISFNGHEKAVIT